MHDENFPESANLYKQSLRRIFKIVWPETISNEHLWKMTAGKPIIQQNKKRKWKWVGYTLRKDSQAIDKLSIGTPRDNAREKSLRRLEGER
jgi:hypothetical protein